MANEEKIVTAAKALAGLPFLPFEDSNGAPCVLVQQEAFMDLLGAVHPPPRKETD